MGKKYVTIRRVKIHHTDRKGFLFVTCSFLTSSTIYDNQEVFILLIQFPPVITTSSFDPVIIPGSSDLLPPLVLISGIFKQ